MTEPIQFFVPGIPAPGGSKRVFGIKKGGLYTGRFVVTDMGGQRNKDWRATVAQAGELAMRNMQLTPLIGPIRVTFRFVMPRPKYHFNSKGVLRTDAACWHTTKPDTTKLIRSTEDALKGICWADDAQICYQNGLKIYGVNPGCYIAITSL
jgi:Holliday junction resolvase RusA-like endonuclease